MGARKRGHEELEASAPAQPASRLHRLRNMWQFANLFQFLFTFGKAIKLEDEVDIEVRGMVAIASCRVPHHAVVRRAC